MKKLFLALAMVGLFTASAFAVDASALKARVPFDFAAGSTELAAGVYTIERHSAQSGVLMLRDDSGHVKALIQTNAVTGRKIGEPAMLVFNKYGDRYFLHRVLNAGSGTGSELRKTKIERELVASAPVQQVMVAAVYR